MSGIARKKVSPSRRTASERPETGGDPPVVEIDDILGEIGAPVQFEAEDEPAYSLDEMLREFDARAHVEAGDSLDDLLDEMAAPQPAEPRDLPDDIPKEMPPPVKAGTAANHDSVLDEIAQPSQDRHAESDAKLEAVVVVPPRALVRAEPTAAKSGSAEKMRLALRKMPGLADLSGTRQISRKTHLTMVGLMGLFAIVAATETVFILVHGVGHADMRPKTVVVTMAPVDFAHIDLQRYIGKRRALHEGGRDVLRNAAVKEAILELENGEELYRDVRGIARHSLAADRMTIADDRVTVVSCDGVACGDKSFRLVYDLVGKHASICMTEKYLNNATLSYSYSEGGYSEVGSCG